MWCQIAYALIEWLAELNFTLDEFCDFADLLVVFLHRELIWCRSSVLLRIVQSARLRVLQYDELACLFLSHND